MKTRTKILTITYVTIWAASLYLMLTHRPEPERPGIELHQRG